MRQRHLALLSEQKQTTHDVSISNASTNSVTRRDMESSFGRFWRVEDTTVTFYPVNTDEPRLGGKVAASVKGFDVSTFTPYTKTYYGVYGEDFVTYGQF